MPDVIRDVRVDDFYEGVDGRLGRRTARREVVLQATGRPRLRRIREHDNLYLAKRHIPAIGTER
jgi:hypothetical protein